ncbi:MAG: hypothetical protein K2X66_10795 [Cyanobacteria bacterium]|nr:hypothetical protein [Cyanobacteriota bacterium]
MSIQFGAINNLMNVANFNHPVTQQPDAVSRKMMDAILPHFNDSLIHYLETSTADEVVINGKRVMYAGGKKPIDGFEINLKLEGIPNRFPGMGSTFGFNPFVDVEKNRNKLQGILTAKIRFLNQWVMMDEDAKRLKKDAEKAD